jgi:hypothetical protein
VDADLERHRLTKERLEKGNDPRFSAVQKAREGVHTHADRAPAAFRREEAAKLDTTRRQLGRDEIEAGVGMRSAHSRAQRSGRLTQNNAVSREAEERRRVASDIEGFYTKAEKDVREKLDWLAGKDGEPGEVDRRFDAGELTSRNNFESFVDTEIGEGAVRTVVVDESGIGDPLVSDGTGDAVILGRRTERTSHPIREPHTRDLVNRPGSA